MEAAEPIEKKLKRLRDAILAAVRGRSARPDPKLDAYLEKVKLHAYKITDEEVAALLAAGHDQDAIFEATVGTALGAGIERLDAGLRALELADEAGER